jgi:hypothetical protein
MGKRSDFERIPHDLYPTPAEAVQPLFPYLRMADIGNFAEPCCGNGDLVRHLEGYGLTCAYRGDIATGQDALASDHYGDIDAVITNPPHSREVMHPMITHFQRIAPMAWLLIDLDWAATVQAVPFLPGCSDIVIIGRVKWFQDSQHNSNDNFGWFRFAADHRGDPVFHNNRTKRRTSVTPAPGEEFRYTPRSHGGGGRLGASARTRRHPSRQPSKCAGAAARVATDVPAVAQREDRIPLRTMLHHSRQGGVRRFDPAPR